MSYLFANCSPASIKSCATIKAKTNGKQLKLSSKKCFQIHIGRSKNLCSTTLKLNDKPITKTDSEHYLGDILSSDNKRDSHINERYNRGIGYVN